MKRVLCVMLSLVFLLLHIPSVLADEEKIYEGYKYVVRDGEIIITGYTNDIYMHSREVDMDFDIEIPETIEGMPVTALADFAFEGAQIITVAGNKNIRNIGIGVFYKCDHLKHITNFPNFYASGSWEYNDNLIYDADGVMVAGTGTETHLNETHAEPDIKVVAPYAFAGRYSAVMNLPNVHTVGEKSFENSHMTFLSLSSLKEIGTSAFERAELTEAYFQDVETVGERAFAGAKGRIVIYGDAPTFAENAFEGCEQLTICCDKNAQGWDNLSFDNVIFERIEPKKMHVDFIQKFEDTGYADEPFAEGTVYYGTSFTDKTMPEFPETEGYFAPKQEGVCWSWIPYDCTISVLYLKVEYFTVSFIDGVTNEVFANAQVKRFDSVTEFPTPPEHDDYVFCEWYGDMVNIDHDVDIYARYEKAYNEYWIYFYDTLGDEENPFAQREVREGEDLTDFPEPPVHNGWTFAGYDNDCKNIQSDLRVKALYTEDIYKVTFIDSRDGAVLLETTAKYGEDVTVFPTPPEHEGYVFTGWNKDGKNITEDTEIRALYRKATTGDMNSDGKINTSDAVFILKAAAGMMQLDVAQTKAGDCNHDGKVNTSDAVLILKYAADMITSF